MPRPKKLTQPRLLPKLEPIGADDAVNLDALTTRYKCRCGNTATTEIRFEAITCVRCGAAMQPEPH